MQDSIINAILVSRQEQVSGVLLRRQEGGFSWILSITTRQRSSFTPESFMFSQCICCPPIVKLFFLLNSIFFGPTRMSLLSIDLSAKRGRELHKCYECRSSIPGYFAEDSDFEASSTGADLPAIVVKRVRLDCVALCYCRVTQCPFLVTTNSTQQILIDKTSGKRYS